MSNEQATNPPVDIGLTEVPETMLWTLHNRCLEANKENGIISDPKAIEIDEAIDYDYEKSFGLPDGIHSIRSLMYDEAILKLWEDYPGGTVVNLGEGLETQRYRLEEQRGDALFISVDLPSAIEARERFNPADKNHQHIAASALDFDEWAKHVPIDKTLFITVQGLFMYLEQEDVQRLFQQIAKRFPASQQQHTSLLFDTISKWLSNKTMNGGWKRTEHYTTPQMPCGVNRFDGPPLLQSWVDGVQIEEIPYRVELMSNFWRYLGPILEMIPIARRHTSGNKLSRFFSIVSTTIPFVSV